ncbi:MAG: hypothetical protein FK731_12685, partial [Asgard group archaeon]|nr:hypothetical protein [Asgard group archaeon]
LLASIYNQDLLNTHNFQFNLQQKNILLANNNELFPRNNKIAYDIIIGNPPFIRQEGHVEEFPGNLTHSEYKEKILTKIENNSFPLKLPRDKKSDFYIYFFYRGISLLKKNGVMCFITPNSWLDVIYGINFKKILLNNFHLKHIYSNNQIKSFRSSINSIISVLIKKHDNNFLPTKFVQFNSNFNDLQRLDLVFNQIIFENYIEDANLQMKTIDRNQLISNLKNQFDFRNKWSSSYFRSPKILTELFNRKPNKFVNLGSIGKIRYSMKTGLNEYFIIDNDIIKKFRIENEFLVPLIKSPKNIKKIQIIKKDLEKRVFNRKMSMETLVKNRKVGALAYINWGKKQRTNKKQQSKGNERYPDVPTVKSHFPYWYSLREVKQADIFCNRFFDKRFYFSFSDDYVIEDQTFYGLKLKEELRKEKMLIIALLNSTLSYLILEVFGRTTLGRGALQYSINDLNMLPILNPRKMSNDDKIKIIDKFKPILSRQIKSIFNECESKDRQEFDLAILNWLGLDKNYLSELYLSLLNLVRNRLKKSVQKMSFY